MMKFAAGLTASGIIGWLLLEALKMLMVPVTAWVIAMLALALKVALMVGGVIVLIALGVFFWKRYQASESEVEVG